MKTSTVRTMPRQCERLSIRELAFVFKELNDMSRVCESDAERMYAKVCLRSASLTDSGSPPLVSGQMPDPNHERHEEMCDRIGDEFDRPILGPSDNKVRRKPQLAVSAADAFKYRSRYGHNSHIQARGLALLDRGRLMVLINAALPKKTGYGGSEAGLARATTDHQRSAGSGLSPFQYWRQGGKGQETVIAPCQAFRIQQAGR